MAGWQGANCEKGILTFCLRNLLDEKKKEPNADIYVECTNYNLFLNHLKQFVNGVVIQCVENVIVPVNASKYNIDYNVQK